MNRPHDERMGNPHVFSLTSPLTLHLAQPFHLKIDTEQCADTYRVATEAYKGYAIWLMEREHRKFSYRFKNNGLAKDWDKLLLPGDGGGKQPSGGTNDKEERSVKPLFSCTKSPSEISDCQPISPKPFSRAGIGVFPGRRLS